MMTNHGVSLPTLPYTNKPVTFTGCGGFLNRRPFAFAPGRAIDVVFCSACGVVSPELRCMSCVHVLCDVCYEAVTRNCGLCPFKDGVSCELMPYSPVAGISERLLKRLEIHCPNAVRGCPFQAKTDEVRVHFLEDCGYGEVACSRCGTSLVHNAVVDHWFRDCDGSRAKKACRSAKETDDADGAFEGDELERSLREFLLCNMRDHELLVRSQNCISALAAELRNTSVPGLRSLESRAPVDDTSVQLIFLVLRLPGEFPLGEDQLAVRWNPEGAVQYFTASGRSFHLRYFSVESDGEQALLFEIRMLVGGAEPRQLRFDGKLTLFLGGPAGVGFEALPTLSSPSSAGIKPWSVKPTTVPDEDVWLTVALTEPVDLERLQKSGLFGLACFAVKVA